MKWILKYESFINENWIKVLEFKLQIQSESTVEESLMQVKWISFCEKLIILQWTTYYKLVTVLEWTYIKRINQFAWVNRHSKNRLLVLNELVNVNRLYQTNEYKVNKWKIWKLNPSFNLRN